MSRKNDFIESNSLIGIIDNFLKKQQYKTPKERGGQSVPPGPPPSPGLVWSKIPGSKTYDWRSKKEIAESNKTKLDIPSFKNVEQLDDFTAYVDRIAENIQDEDERLAFDEKYGDIIDIAHPSEITNDIRQLIGEFLQQYPIKNKKRHIAPVPKQIDAPIVQPPKATKQQNANYPLPSAMTDEYRKKMQSMKGTQEGALHVMQYLNHHDDWNTWGITDELSDTTIKNAKHDIALLSEKQDQLSDRQQIRMQKLSRYFWGKLFGGKKTGRPGLWTERYKAVKEAKARGELPSGIRKPESTRRIR